MIALVQRLLDSFLGPSLRVGGDIRNKAQLLIVLILFLSVISWFMGRSTGSGEGTPLGSLIGIWIPLLLLGNLAILRWLGNFNLAAYTFLGEYLFYGALVSLADIHGAPFISS
ncbi:MAG: hypothetical protein CL569_16730 [Alphaproteobacteria bacterium]|nr:hypothetical protein [Alphaproteobacteria bacterium]|tara:strand:- start:1007 stop:1345 length:339 start_codon:yes stop_codon:yes gene_type:complete